MSDTYDVEIETEELDYEKKTKIIDEILKISKFAGGSSKTDKGNESIEAGELEKAKEHLKKGYLFSVKFELDGVEWFSLKVGENSKITISVEDFITEPWTHNPWTKTVRQTFDRIIKTVQKAVKTEKIVEFFGADKDKKMEYAFGEKDFEAYYLRWGYEKGNIEDLRKRDLERLEEWKKENEAKK